MLAPSVWKPQNQLPVLTRCLDILFDLAEQLYSCGRIAARGGQAFDQPLLTSQPQLSLRDTLVDIGEESIFRSLGAAGHGDEHDRRPRRPQGHRKIQTETLPKIG